MNKVAQCLASSGSEADHGGRGECFMLRDYIIVVDTTTGTALRAFESPPLSKRNIYEVARASAKKWLEVSRQYEPSKGYDIITVSAAGRKNLPEAVVPSLQWSNTLYVAYDLLGRALGAGGRL